MGRLARHSAIVLAVLLVALAAACSNVEVPDLDQDVRDEGIMPKDWRPMPLRIGVAPFRANLELAVSKYNLEDTNRWVLAPNKKELNGPEGLHNEFIDVLRKYRIFEEVESIDGAAPDTDRKELQRSALEQGLDLILIPVVKRRDVGYVDTNGSYGWNMFLWWMASPIFTWWIADEDFDANLHIELRLYPVTGGDQLESKRLQPPEQIIRSLDDWDHGWNAFSIFTAPGHFDKDNWNKVGDLLMPIAENEAKKAALRYFVKELSRTSRGSAFLERIRRRVGLIIGVDGSGQPGLPLSRYAASDAQGLSALLLNAYSSPLVEGAVRTLSGAAARRKAVLRAADELSELARDNDDVFIALCGVGTLTPDGELAMVLAQPPGTGRKLETVTVKELLARVLVNRPRTLTLYLDCSFVAPGDKRCAVTEELLAGLPPQPENGGRKTLLESVVKQCKKAGTECIILSSTRVLPGLGQPEKSLEIEDLGQALFSNFVIDGLAGAADRNGDHKVTVEELAIWTTENVVRVAELEGETQVPYFYISPARKGYVLPSWQK